MKPPGLENRFDLDDVIGREDLENVSRSLARVSGWAAGLVRMPPDDMELPQNREEFDLWRLTDVHPVKTDESGEEVGYAFELCHILRGIEALDRLCMWSDLEHAREAWRLGKPVDYLCEPAGLVDIVAPVEVAGKHVANIYVGRARHYDFNFDHLYAVVTENLRRKGEPEPPDLRAKLMGVYDRLPELRDNNQLEALKLLLAAFAELLSQRANRQVVLKEIANVAATKLPFADERECATAFYKKCKEIMEFDSGSVFVLERKLGMRLESRALDWNEDQSPYQVFGVDDQGLIPFITRQALKKEENQTDEVEPSKLCRSRAEMDEITAPAIADSRDGRNIQSFVGVPIMYGETVLGVMEIGSQRTHAYTEDDLYLLKAIARYLGIALRATQERSHMLNIMAQTDLRELLNAVVEHLPDLVAGNGCSIFMKVADSSDAPAIVLLGSSELLASELNKASYKPGEGLTGFVFKYGQPLNIPARSKEHLKPIHPDLQWAGKYAPVNPQTGQIDRDYYVNRPFLACPIRTRNMTVGVLRIGDRLIDGMFTFEDEQTVQACADMIGAVFERADLRSSVAAIQNDLQTHMAESRAEHGKILDAVEATPQATVKRLSLIGIGAFAASILFYQLTNLTVVDPGLSLLGIVACATYWLMARISEPKHMGQD